MLAGSTVGEIGWYRQQPRSATVRAVEGTALLKPSAAQLAALAADEPAMAAALHRLFLLQLASRLDRITLQAHLLAR